MEETREEVRESQATKDESELLLLRKEWSALRWTEREREKGGMSERHREGNGREESRQRSKTQRTGQDSECICDTDPEVFCKASVSRAAQRQKNATSQPSPPLPPSPAGTLHKTCFCLLSARM